MSPDLFPDAALPASPCRRRVRSSWLVTARAQAEVLVERRVCPSCSGCGLDPMLRACAACHNTGLLLVGPEEWRAAGAIHRAQRRRRAETVHESGRRMGCSGLEVAAMERGELPLPSQLL
jgi:hypothetical protein